MKVIFHLGLFLCFFNFVHCQKTQPSEFQRYSFGTIERYIKEKCVDTLDAFTTKAYSINTENTALAFKTKLVGFNALVRYQFQNGRLKGIYYETRCRQNNGIIRETGQSNDCTTSTLKEFFKLKSELTELYGTPSRCIGCQVCYTKDIEIPFSYNITFENELKAIAKDYPNNSKICVSWQDFTNNSVISLAYDVTMGWILQTVVKIEQSDETVSRNEVSLARDTNEEGIVANKGGGVTFNGYSYSTVVLGNGQEWMAENLRTSSYANGDPIPNVTSEKLWQNLTTGAWVYYNNDKQHENPYGKLYNWYTVNDSRNICPTGWHVPSDVEWSTLIDYLGDQTKLQGGKMKITGVQYWLSPNSDATNESGFSGLPGGFRDFNGKFDELGYYGTWWSSTEDESNFAWIRGLSYDDGYVYIGTLDKLRGYSVRCLRD